MPIYPKLNQSGLDKYPKFNPLLTNAAWEKNKGFYAKMAGTTNVGAALIVMGLAYRAVDWKFILFTPYLNKDEVIGWGQHKVLEVQHFAKENCEKAAFFKEKLDDVVVKAKGADTKFRASKLPNISKGKKAAADILKAAQDMQHEYDKVPYAITYKQWDAFVKEFAARLV